ncbi:MAG: integrase [Bacteroidetes bacterium]|nr:MAG: integrase [Bacteroidota bacterium]
MKHNVKFSPEKRKDSAGNLIAFNVPLFADIRYGGQRLFYFTGYRVDFPDWQDGQLIKTAVAVEGKRQVTPIDVNRRLKLIQAALVTLFDPLLVAPSKETIKSTLDQACKKVQRRDPEPDKAGFTFMFETYLSSGRLSAGRVKQGNSALNHWQRFAAKKNITLSFEAITPETLRSFERFLLTEKTKGKKTGKVSQTRGLNSIHSILTLTRAFWNFARKELTAKGTIIDYPFESYRVPGEVYGTPIYLTLEERDKLYNSTLSSDRLTRVRDIFIFQCLTGMRVGDMVQLTRSNITGNKLSYIAQKTKENPVTITVPLSSKALDILSRYNRPDGRLLPFITDQRYNDYLKELFKEVGITRTVTRQNPKTREPEQVRICDIASSHIARRSFIGNLFGKVDSAIIASMSGHTKGSKAFNRYYDVSEDLQKQAIDLID